MFITFEKRIQQIQVQTLQSVTINRPPTLYNKELLIGECLTGVIFHLHPHHDSWTRNPMPRHQLPWLQGNQVDATVLPALQEGWDSSWEALWEWGSGVRQDGTSKIDRPTPPLSSCCEKGEDSHKALQGQSWHSRRLKPARHAGRLRNHTSNPEPPNTNATSNQSRTPTRTPTCNSWCWHPHNS